MGIYIFNKRTLDRVFEENTTSTDFGKEFIPKEIESGGRVFSYQFDGYWTDIGTITSFFDANLELVKPLPSFNLYDNENYIYTRARLLPGSKLMRSEERRVGTGCRYVEGAVHGK